jgi:hypothetical protein
MTESSGGYRGLARGLPVAAMLGAALVAMTGCSARGTAGPVGPTGHPTTGQPTALPGASCGEAATHDLSGATQFFQADAGALSCFATAARQCQSASIAITEMGVDTGTRYVFAIVPGAARCQGTEWSQYYSANFGGSTGKVSVTQCSATAGTGGVTLGCGGQDILIPVTVTNSATASDPEPQ